MKYKYIVEVEIEKEKAMTEADIKNSLNLNKKAITRLRIYEISIDQHDRSKVDQMLNYYPAGERIEDQDK